MMNLQFTIGISPSLCSKLYPRELLHIILLFSLLIASIVSYCIFHPQSLLQNVGFLSRILPNKTSSYAAPCDYSYGKWIFDESYPLQKYTEKCPFLDPGFRCQQNGRSDTNFRKWRWKPAGCDLPRFNAIEFLTRFRNGRVIFAGDSIGRNQWESLVCMLAQGVSNISNVFEEMGKPITKHKGYLSMRFADYNLTVEYYRVPFLVSVDRPPKTAPKEVVGTIRVDKLHWFSTKWIGASLLVFSAGHWWQPDKTRNAGHYFQEGDKVNMSMDVKEAFRRTLNTLMQWASRNLDYRNSQIVFRSYSPVHYSNLTWNTGGNCHKFTTPEPESVADDIKQLEPGAWNNLFISELIKQMQNAKMKAKLLNITYLTELRKDGHPSRHREPGTPISAPQDCSHWCLPGVPDTWNELVYAYSMTS